MEKVDQQDQSIKKIEVERPWLVDSVSNTLQKARIGHKLKIIGYVALVIFGLYVMKSYFGWYFLGGFAVIPFLGVWVWRQMDREAILLLELRIPNEKFFDGSLSPELKTMIHQIPPDIWRKIRKTGIPFEAGKRFYICDKFDKNNEIIYFPRDPMVSNLWFWTRTDIWLEFKKEIPELKQQIAVQSINSRKVAMDMALDILEKVGILDNFKDHVKPRRTVKRSDEPNIAEAPGGVVNGQ